MIANSESSKTIIKTSKGASLAFMNDAKGFGTSLAANKKKVTT